MGVNGGGGQTKEYGPWMATMEVTRGRGIFPTVMARVEITVRHETRDRDGRQGALAPWKRF